MKEHRCRARVQVRQPVAVVSARERGLLGAINRVDDVFIRVGWVGVGRYAGVAVSVQLRAGVLERGCTEWAVCQVQPWAAGGEPWAIKDLHGYTVGPHAA